MARTVGLMRQSGFTLLELMIAVVVIGILASIAYPLYTGYVERARRTDAHAGLMDTAQVLERCYTVYSSYNNGSCSISNESSVSSPDENYTITVDSTDTGYDLSAEFVGSGDDGCSGDLTLNHKGVRGPDDCW